PSSLTPYSAHLPLHSFPTRRSSDLSARTFRNPQSAIRNFRRPPLSFRTVPCQPPVPPPLTGHHWLRGSRSSRSARAGQSDLGREDRKSTRLNSSHVKISYAVFCLKK